VDGLWPTKSEDVEDVVQLVSKTSNLCDPDSTNVTLRQTDTRQTELTDDMSQYRALH